MRTPRSHVPTMVGLVMLVASCGGGGSDAPANTGPSGGSVPSDTTPETFAFVDQDGAVVNTIVISAPITISGIDQASNVSIAGGEYSINGADFVTSSGSVVNGAQIEVRVGTPSGFRETVEATLTVGGVSDTFSVTTGDEDITPTWFSFDHQSDIGLSTFATSDAVTISGINGDIEVTVSDGEYSVDGGEFVSEPGTIVNEQTLTVRHVSSNRSNMLSAATVTVGSFTTQLSVETGRFYVEAGEYADLPVCAPYVGSSDAPFKVVFLNISDAPQFEAIVDDAINNQFAVVPPFSDRFSSFGFYKLDVGDGANYDCQGLGTSNSNLGFRCNSQLLNEEIERQCSVDDAEGLVKIAVAESQYSASALDFVWLTDNLSTLGRTAIHEVGHNFGLGDLYIGGYSASGDPVYGWSREVARQWLNLDAPGCPKWCDSAKSVEEYTQSTSAACLTFTTKDQCLAFNRPTRGDCGDPDGDSLLDCCSWVDTPTDDYFNTSCVPVQGTEDIGLSCVVGAGCYFGGGLGVNAWRPVGRQSESLMFSLEATEFDTVSYEALVDVLDCCTDVRDGEESCADFRQRFSDFLIDVSEKRRLGSCGVH